MNTKSIQNTIKLKLKNEGADFIHFVDISQLHPKQNKGFPSAILFGIVLSKDYLKEVTATPDFVEQKKKNNTIKFDEFHLTELKTDQIADQLERYLISEGFNAFSQSEDNLANTGNYNEANKTTLLPHKTIAGMAGLGWIGKHNLLVTPEYGSAISMCTVLCNAPLETKLHGISKSKCGDCTICIDICKPNALKGTIWETGISRDKIVDVFSCKPCLQCVVQCPWTQKYINQKA